MKRLSPNKASMLQCLLRKVHDKVPCINYGGCGIFASYLLKIMVKKGYKCQAVCLNSTSDRTKQEHQQNLSYIDRKNAEVVFAYNHICLKIGNYFVDSTHVEKACWDGIFSGTYKKLGEIGGKQLQYLISLAWKWNDLYDRRQNKRLGRLLSKTLQPL